jgi:hypothetical protein
MSSSQPSHPQPTITKNCQYYPAGTVPDNVMHVFLSTMPGVKKISNNEVCYSQYDDKQNTLVALCGTPQFMNNFFSVNAECHQNAAGLKQCVFSTTPNPGACSSK